MQNDLAQQYFWDYVMDYLMYRQTSDISAPNPKT